jgi:hypothetical protein
MSEHLRLPTVLAGIQGDHVGVGVPALGVRMLPPDPRDGVMMMPGCSRGHAGAGFVSAIIAVPEDRGGVIDWRSDGSAPCGQHEMTPSQLSSW